MVGAGDLLGSAETDGWSDGRAEGALVGSGQGVSQLIGHSWVTGVPKSVNRGHHLLARGLIQSQFRTFLLSKKKSSVSLHSMVGRFEGSNEDDGPALGIADGVIVGPALGDALGVTEGDELGVKEGAPDGLSEGFVLGSRVWVGAGEMV